MNEKQVDMIVESWALGLLLLLFQVLPTSWFAMLALGAAHAQWPQVPALGFGATFVMVAAASFLAKCFR